QRLHVLERAAGPGSIAEQLRRGGAPSEIVRRSEGEDARRGRNSPCTCGGREWKRCQGAAVASWRAGRRPGGALGSRSSRPTGAQMPMLAIHGVFKVTQAQPDGDSIRFYPDDPAPWSLVPGIHKVRTNAGGGAQLRLDGIDALETHYTPQGGSRLHQPLGLAHEAADRLLELLGFAKVERGPDETVTSSTPAEVAGYVLTRTADLYGRCVALAGKGAAPGPSGTQVVVKMAQLRKTVNYTLMQEGLVYPTYYRLLFADL